MLQCLLGPLNWICLAAGSRQVDRNELKIVPGLVVSVEYENDRRSCIIARDNHCGIRCNRQITGAITSGPEFAYQVGAFQDQRFASCTPIRGVPPYPNARDSDRVMRVGDRHPHGILEIAYLTGQNAVTTGNSGWRQGRGEGHCGSRGYGGCKG